ncbi:MAG TPA: toll/interleukin-1 receptor domain-containing protein, partial [Candidatus Sulfotelmatobacter sp.]|nr:toll/interleukin-1 receptor domain-containing protein [Candidatus Sulfotelmatobacter sp.]
MKERLWTNLIAALRHGQCILMLGPEIPATAQNNASGATLIGGLKGKLRREMEDDNRQVYGNTLAAVAQQYEDAYESNSLQSTAEGFYRSCQYGPSTVHDRLASLPFSLIVTTAQDDLLRQALANAKKEPLVHHFNLRGDKIANPEFMIPGSPTQPVVYHLFGEASDPPSLVLSENDLLDFLIAVVSERSSLPNSLLRALKRKGQSFLFLGFGVRHWDLRILSKLLLRALDQSHSTSIAAEPVRNLLPQPDREEMVLFYQRGTRVEVEDTDIGEFLSEVLRRLEAEGGYAGQLAPLGSRPRVFISYAREDADLAQRLFAALQKEYFDPWLDSESLGGGEDWDKRIRQDLATSHFT